MSSKSAKEQRCVSPSPSEDDNLSAASPKRGRKESEQRRRVMMNQYFDELIALLSMLSERCIPKKMDKATTLHEAVQCIQIYSDLTSKPERTLTLDTGKTPKSSKAPPKSPSPTQTEVLPDGSVQGLHTVGELLHFFLDSHDAFLMVISDSGRILYSTELITSLLGHMQTRLVGQNFFDFVHENDHSIFQDLLKSDHNGVEGLKLKDRPIIAYPPKLILCHLRLYSGETGYFPQYLQFKTVVYLRKWDTEHAKHTSSSDMCPASPDPSSSESGYSCDSENQSCIVMVGKLPTSLSMVDLPVGTNDVNFEFEMRVSREGRIIDVDKHAVTVLGFTTSEIIGTSFFDYIDPYHLLDVSEGMSTFLSSGLGTTTPYRLQTKGGRSIWLISKGYLSYNPWNNKPDHILLTNRVLGCDQVLPEHRFFRSRKLLPDTEGHECYVPNIPVSRSSPMPASPPPVTTRSTALSTPDSGILSNTTEGRFNSASNLSVTQQHPQHQQQHPQQQQQPPQPALQQHLPQQTPSFQPQPQPNLVRTQSSSATVQQQAMLHVPPQQGGIGIGGGGGGEQGGAGGNILQTTSTAAPASSIISNPATPASSLQRIDSAGTLLSTAQSPGMLPAAPSPSQGMPSIQNLEDIQRELERKNREIFEMQKKLFEQQKLFEQERNQFYSITAQVMQCISSNAMNQQIPPNMQMVFSTSGDYNSSSMVNTQPKIVMESPLQSTQRDPYTGGSVQTATTHTPLWDTSAQQLTMDNFSNTCPCSTTQQQQYVPALQQAHPQQHPQQVAPPLQQQQPPQVHAQPQHQVAPQPQQQQPPQVHAQPQHQQPQQQQQQQQHQQHQIQQSPYGTTPATSMPVSTVNFTAVSDYMPVTTSNITSASGMVGPGVQQQGGMLSEQFGLSQAFKMAPHQSLAEHNMQFFHQQISPHQQQQQQQAQTGPGGQNTGHLAPVSQSPVGGGYHGVMMSSNVLSNLSSPSGSVMNLSTLSVGGMQPPSQKSQQQSLPPENLADILNSARFP